MSVNAINNISNIQTTNTTTKNIEKAAETVATKKEEKNDGVIYDRNSSTVNTEYVKKNSALIQKLKEDSDARVNQLRGIVEKMMQQQGAAIGKADDIWSFLAKGDFTVTPEVKAQAQADIAEDGYWGVKQTSDRILDFAKALSGNNPEKADLLLDAFKKGFKEATGAWGDELPEISQKTYDAVLEKFEAWKNGTEEDTTAQKTTDAV